MSRDMVRHASFTTALTPTVWGTTYLVATEFLPAGWPLLAAIARALPVGVIFVARTRRLPTGHWWWRVIVSGVLNIGAFFALLFVAAFRLPGGVALLVLGPQAALDPIGVAAALAGTISMATGVVLTKHWGRPVDLVTFTGWQLTVGGTVLVPVMLVVEGMPDAISPTNAAGFVWLAVVGTGLAYVNWFRGIQLLPVAIVSFLGLLSPLVATVAGWIVLDQSLTTAQLLGAALVVSAIILTQSRARPAVPAVDQVPLEEMSPRRMNSVASCTRLDMSSLRKM